MFGIKLVKESDWTNLKEEVTSFSRQLEDIGWINLSANPLDQSGMFPGSFKQMLKTCKVYYYKNPLAGQWVNLTTQFVFGEGLSNPKCEEERIQEIVDEFWDDEDNKKSLTSFPAQVLISNKIQYEGNLFFALFTDIMGRVKVRLLNTEEVDDVICDNDDRMRVNFYKVAQLNRQYNFLSNSYAQQPQKFVYYPSNEVFDITEFKIPPDRLNEDVRVIHVKINCDINDKFGVPELFRGIDWIKAHKDMQEDMATLVKALSQFAWKKKVKGSPAQVNTIADAMRSKMNLTSIKNSAGQMQVENDGVDLQSIDIKQGGIKIGVDAGRQMKLMVCAASGIFEHYFGDPSTGNLATSKSMELPMVKKFVNYQSLWTDIYKQILNFVIDRKIETGELQGNEEVDEKAKRRRFVTNFSRDIDIDFPPILEEDLKPWAEALQTAKSSGLVSEELAAQLFLLAANVNNVDEELEKVMGENEEKAKKAEEQFGITAGIDPRFNNGNGSDKTNASSNGNGNARFGNQKAAVKEAIETPAKKILLRGMKKENYVHQKMNSYRKAVAGHWRKLLREVRNDVKTSTLNGKVIGDVTNFNRSMAEFIESMKEEARKYFPMAIEIGQKFMQANLKDMFPDIKLEETLYEANGKASNILEKRLLWNDRYISSSLEPALLERFHEAVRDEYESPAAFRKALNDSLNAFENRIELYIGAFWIVEQEAVKESGKGTGVMVNFVGPDDTHTCPGCEDAVAGSPWPIDEAPLPGEQECLGNCRHALQIVEGSKE